MINDTVTGTIRNWSHGGWQQYEMCIGEGWIGFIYNIIPSAPTCVVKRIFLKIWRQGKNPSNDDVTLNSELLDEKGSNYYDSWNM